jgi:hypothetical protein
MSRERVATSWDRASTEAVVAPTVLVFWDDLATFSF